GEIVGLIGPNGAGKTTVFHVVAGFYPPTEGAIAFEGTSLVGLKPHAICRLGLARTFQLVQPFAGLTTLENVMVGAFNRAPDVGAARRRAAEIVEFVGLGPRRDVPARHLTLPDRKRLEVARGLATEPRLLLLDEVMSGLNPTVIEAGEILSVVGANGAGKTTMLRAISGLLRPRAGEILLDGVRLDRLPSHAVVEQGVVQVPEGRKIFPSLTVLENLELGSYVRAARAHRRESLERVLALFPILAERRGQAAGNMSGGQQQMLAIGRALMARPRLLMLDEPSLGL